MASNQGNYDNAANTPYWVVNSAIAHGGIDTTTGTAAVNAGKLYGNTTPDMYITGETIGVFLVDNTEIHAGSDNVGGVSIVQGGTGYVEAPAVTFSGGGGSGAAATATISGGKVTSITVTNTGSSYETVPTVSINNPAVTIPTSGVNTNTEQFTYSGHGLSVGDPVKYYNAGGTSVTGLTNATTYYVSALGFSSSTFRLAPTTGDVAARTAVTTGYAISGSTGQFTCAAMTLAVGDHIVITGTKAGTSTFGSYTTGNIYEVSSVTGTSPNVTGFTLTNEDTTALTTAAGTLTGLTLTPYTIKLISGTGNNSQYFDKVNQTTATAIADMGLGADGDGNLGTRAVHAGWNMKTTGTGGRAGRVQWETLSVVSSIRNDGSDDITLPDA